MTYMPGEWDLKALVRNLAELPEESACVEFKVNNTDPQQIGQYISALSNSAAIAEQHRAFMVWGVADESHDIVGTTFDPSKAKKGEEELESWLTRLLSPQIFFKFFSVELDEKRAVVLEVSPAIGNPTTFQGEAYVRIGSYKKRLRSHPGAEQQLWQALGRRSFEGLFAKEGLSEAEVVALIDYPCYFKLLKLPLPESRAGIIESLERDGICRRAEDGRFAITNLGGLLFAANLADFPSLSRKSLRVVQYSGNSRIKTLREQVGQRGYACGFSGLIDYLTTLLPQNEVLGQALRVDQPLYPPVALRELLANAIIHQDFTLSGRGPMLEIFDNRLEISNPGSPLVKPERFLDSPPLSRNETIAAMMRRIGICEERGSGWDKVAFEVEFHQLPAPLVEVSGESTRTTLFAHRPLSAMDKEDRVRALYLHACLKWVSREHMTNTTVRERLGIDDRNKAQASRYIREAVEARAIKPYDASAGPRAMRYVPFWADGSQGG